MTTTGLFYLGDTSRGGNYVLRMRVSEPFAKPFGDFKGRKIISVVPGDYVYIGSALVKKGSAPLANKGPAPLARRVVRHAARTGANPPHPIQAVMLKEFPLHGLCEGFIPSSKRPLWNVDHLLEEPCAELIAAYLIRSPEPIEKAVQSCLKLKMPMCPLCSRRGSAPATIQVALT